MDASYNRTIHPEFSEEEALVDCCRSLRVKYGTGGYATTKMFFHDPEYEKFILEIEEITADPTKYMRMQREHNKKKAKKI